MTKTFFAYLTLLLIAALSACGSGSELPTAGAPQPGFYCMRAETAPPAPKDGAVLWASPSDVPKGNNVIVLGLSGNVSRYLRIHNDPNDACYPAIKYLRTINIDPKGKPLVAFCHNLFPAGDQRTIVPWGAVNVGLDDPTKPSDFTRCWEFFHPKNPKQNQYMDLAVVDPTILIGFGSACPGCDFSKKNLLFEGPSFQSPLPQNNFTGANFQHSHLTGYASGFNFTNADFTNAAFIKERYFPDQPNIFTPDLRGANFNGAILENTDFRQAKIGGGSGVGCTSFSNTNLMSALFDVSTWDLGCAGALFSQTQVSLDLPYQLLTRFAVTDVNLTGSEIVVTPKNWRVLSSMDLTGINLSNARFLGVPADFTGTNFTKATLVGTQFGRGIFKSAHFNGANAANASFFEANLAGDNAHPGADFSSPKSGSRTTLTHANFVKANVSAAAFRAADLSGAVFSGARAVGTDFTSVRAPNADFSGAHMSGNVNAFNNATDLSSAKFIGAVLVGDPSTGAGFNFYKAPLTSASFDNVVCINCDFSNATLTSASFNQAYLPGVTLSTAILNGTSFNQAWFYCGVSNSQCKQENSSTWDWPLYLGSGETSGIFGFHLPNFTNASFAGVAACPDGQPPNSQSCDGHLLPAPPGPPLPAPCSASADGACPTATVTISGNLSAPLAIVPTASSTWNTLLPPTGYYVGLDDATVQFVSNQPGSIGKVIAGTSYQHCTNSHAACGDGKPAAEALLGTPNGLAVGLDGSIYIADPQLHRVRKIDPTGIITSVVGTGEACRSTSPRSCGDGGLAKKGQLFGPFGVWVDPIGVLYIADGTRGIRHVDTAGTLTTLSVGSATHDVRSLTLLPTPSGGMIYASTASPDAIIQVDAVSGAVSTVVGTGTSGYNGNEDSHGFLRPGTEVQVNGPLGVAIDRGGNVVFADTRNNLIRAYVPSTTHVKAVLAGVVSNNQPEGGFNGDGRYANHTLLNAPEAVATTDTSQLVIADTGNHGVRLVGPIPNS